MSLTEAALGGALVGLFCSTLGFIAGWLLGWEQRDRKAAIQDDRLFDALDRARQERDDAKAALTELLDETQEWRAEAQRESKTSPSGA
jgi:hypothetical protein